MTPEVQEANSRRYNCAGVLRLDNGTYAFFESGYRLVEAGISAERLIELLNQYDHSRRLYLSQVEAYGGEVKRIGPKDSADILKELGL